MDLANWLNRQSWPAGLERLAESFLMGKNTVGCDTDRTDTYSVHSTKISFFFFYSAHGIVAFSIYEGSNTHLFCC